MHHIEVQIADDHAAALDILLLLADARARGREYGRALDLLGEAEAAGAGLPAEYLLKRRQWECAQIAGGA